MLQYLDPQLLLPFIGLYGTFAIIFAESGLFFGFFLPGDSLLFAVGFLAAQGVYPIAILLLVLPVMAILGDSVGYWFGCSIGRKLFEKKDSRIFKRAYLEKTEQFYNRHGSKTIVLARFVPVVRTFAPILAGIAGMSYRTFISFNVLGGFLWTWGLLLAGYFLSAVLPNADALFIPIVSGVVLLSLVPAGISFVRSRFYGRRE